MSRYSLHRPRRNRAVWDRSATGTRLLPKSSPTTVSPGYPLPGDGRSIDYTRHTLFHGHSRVRALSERRSTPATATRPSGGIGHDAIVPCLEAIAPPAHSTVAYLGKLPSHSDGSEDALLPPFRMAERVWDLIPFLDSPVVPLGEPQPVSDGSESALPSLRMVERVPWTDLAPHREIPSRLVHLSKGLWGRHVAVDATGIGTGAAASLPESHGPSIAFPSLQPPIYPLTLSKMRRGVSSVEGSSASKRPQQPTTHERDRLLAHTSIISHAHPFPITCAPIPGDTAQKLSLEQSNRHGFNQKRSEIIKDSLIRPSSNPCTEERVRGASSPLCYNSHAAIHVKYRRFAAFLKPRRSACPALF